MKCAPLFTFGNIKKPISQGPMIPRRLLLHFKKDSPSRFHHISSYSPCHVHTASVWLFRSIWVKNKYMFYNFTSLYYFWIFANHCYITFIREDVDKTVYNLKTKSSYLQEIACLSYNDVLSWEIGLVNLKLDKMQARDFLLIYWSNLF